MRFVNLITVFVSLAAAAPAPAATPTKDDMIAVTTVAPTASGDPVTYWSASPESVKVCDEDTYLWIPQRHFLRPRACEDDSEYGLKDGHVDIVKSGSCAFSVRADAGLMVGDEDIVWIMRKAVLNNSDGMEMAARGSVKCKPEEGRVMGGLYWEIHGIESTGY
ncbi:hypothetical protein FCULG_00000701 [Fusarium culmorum]|uniref:Ecp2 effector protein-like domain-containing protein n=1 Tax=Fusarium culmorum TaxID=5516 RepID=A0A2T4GIX3_FUSCU|nr:hypothetical protein FCULG_00000701 [Fusarium culmorum]